MSTGPTPPSSGGPGSTVVSPARRQQLRRSLAALRDRLARAETAAGRAPGSVTLIAVTKTFPATDAACLAGLGCTELGENRDQEASAKAAAVADILPPSPTAVRWHFIGQLQRNKAASVVSYAHLVHSVDRPRLARALNTAAGKAGRRLPVLIQLSLDEPDAGPGALGPRAGVAPEELSALAATIEGLPALRLSGLMGVAPAPAAGATEAAVASSASAAFARLQQAHAGLLQQVPQATVLSAGMSHDLEYAIAHGATHVRVGGALLGSRAPIDG